MNMPQYTEFDPLSCPLNGMNLIESSAGTGKTHTIGSLFLRLLLERHLDVGEILVVTFTQAATEELKERIRARLKEALEVFSGKIPADEFLAALKHRAFSQDQAIATLNSSLRRFDEASIYTIHGFCARVLADHAFEMAQPFDLRLITQEEELYEKIAYDFWRKQLYKAPPEFVNFAVTRKFFPMLLARLAKDIVTWPDLIILPAELGAELPDLSPLRSKFLQMKEVWPNWESELSEVLLSPSLNGNKYGSLNIGQNGLSKRQSLISVMMDQMNRWLAMPWPLLPLFTHFEKFTAQYLSKNTKKGKLTPEHEFFELAQEFHELASKLQEKMDAYLLRLKVEFARSVRDRLDREKSENNVKGYQDLIIKTAEALKGPNGNKIIAHLRKYYKAALIDEFHDTDSAQYSIFTSVFGHDSRALFLVGDPKQAIYAFRGADIFAYLRATHEVHRRYTLRTNWRTVPSLVNAINTLFRIKQRPFLFEQIEFVDTVPTKGKKIEQLKIDGHSIAPLRFWYLEQDPEYPKRKSVSVTRARALLAKAVACEICHLIRLGKEGRATLDDTPVKEKHIAVLVRTNQEAFIIQDALRASNVHAVLYSGEDVFGTAQAWEIEQVAGAVATPEDAQLVRGALATEIFGFDASDLLLLDQDAPRWEEIILKFRQYRRVWERSGFVAMFYQLLQSEGTFKKLLGTVDGERKISNLIQISEAVQEAAVEKSLGLHGTVTWLASQRNAEPSRSQERQLRLESDDEAVTVLTIHKSKGLEFPIVFCPYAWAGTSSENKEEILVHLPDRKGKFVYDFGSPHIDEHRALAAKEELAENIRLLYVALTRAKSACYVAWGDINQTDSSALAYLLCGPDDFGGDEVVSQTRRLYGLAVRDGLKEKLAVLQRQSKGDMEILSPPLEGKVLQRPKRDAKSFIVRKFRGHIPKDWGVGSFSSLISDYELATDFPDYDIVASEGVSPADLPYNGAGKAQESILDFPRGPRAGSCLHKILELVDFSERHSEKYIEIIRKRLMDFGYDSSWTDAIYRMVHNLVNARLEPSEQGPRIGLIPMTRRLNEVEFYFPLRKISPMSLGKLFEDTVESEPLLSLPERIGALSFSPIKGFMKGFIDMVFEWEGRYYLVDWKSNFLGPTLEDYGQERMAQEMAKHLYVLQYHLYCVALDQFLRLRVPDYSYEKCFGAVYYVFLRGVDPIHSPEYGIYRARPTAQVMQRLTRNLLDIPR